MGDGTASRSEAYSGNTRRGRERGNVKSSVKKRYIRHDEECSLRLCTFNLLPWVFDSRQSSPLASDAIYSNSNHLLSCCVF